MYIYILRYPGWIENQYKIGISVNPKKRLQQHNTSTGEISTVYEVFESIHYKLVEKIVHYRLRNYHKEKEHYIVDLDTIRSEIKNAIKYLDDGSYDIPIKPHVKPKSTLFNTLFRKRCLRKSPK